MAMPSTMFITSPIWLFMNCSASQPAMPPMMMAAIQPICCSSIWRGVGAEVELDAAEYSCAEDEQAAADACRRVSDYSNFATRPRSRA